MIFSTKTPYQKFLYLFDRGWCNVAIGTLHSKKRAKACATNIIPFCMHPPTTKDTATTGSKLLCLRVAEVWKHWLVRSGQCRGRCFGNPLPCLCCHGRLHLRIPKRFHPIFISIRLTVRSRNDMTKAMLVKFIEHAMHAAKFRQEAADRLISRNWRMLYGNVNAVKRTG